MKTPAFVIVRGQVFRRDEKEPFTASGFSYRGALEYDDQSNRLRCHECGEWHQHIGVHCKVHPGGSLAYKLKHGLNRQSALVVPSVSAKLAAGRIGKPICVPINLGKRNGISGGGDELRNDRGICRAQLIERLVCIACEIGRTPPALLNNKTKRIMTRAQKEFGSWAEFCKAAGLQPNANKNRHLPDAVLIEALKDFYVLNKRLPRKRDFNKGSLPAPATFRRHFGTMGAAYWKAGLHRVRGIG